jgi:hypothetical protein
MNRGVKILACVALGILAIFLIGYVTMSLWNWLVPALFNGPVLTFWQALGLLFLSKILFGGFGGKRGWSNHPARQAQWKARFFNKFSSMTPEERELVKQKMKEKWCHWEDKAAGRDSGSSND